MLPPLFDIHPVMKLVPGAQVPGGIKRQVGPLPDDDARVEAVRTSDQFTDDLNTVAPTADGQRDQAAIAMMATSLVSLAAQHSPDESGPRPARFYVLDGSPGDAAYFGYLERLSRETDETATLSLRTGWERVYIDQVTPERDVKMMVQLGLRAPLHAGASTS